MNLYQQRISEVLQRPASICAGVSRLDPAIVEAWMRVECPTLDGLSPERFDRLALTAAACAKVSNASANIALAASFGLKSQAEADAADELRKPVLQ